MTPLAIVGEPEFPAPAGAPVVVHIGRHTTGVPEQSADPAGSNAATYAPPWLGIAPSPYPGTYSTPSATTGAPCPGVNPGPVVTLMLVAHRGLHIFGVPEQFVVPAAAYVWIPSASVTKIFPSATVKASKSGERA